MCVCVCEFLELFLRDLVDYQLPNRPWTRGEQRALPDCLELYE